MSIRESAQAVEKANQQVEQARKPPTPAQILSRKMAAQKEQFKLVLPRTMDADQFTRQVISAVKTTPKLLNCFMTPQGEISVYLAAMQAGTMGLMPNTPAQEAWLLPRRVKSQDGKYVDECQLAIGYRGYIKLIRNAGNIKTIYAEVVREGDEFQYERGLERDVLRHVPSGNEDGELTHAYAVVRYNDIKVGDEWVSGGYQFIVLGKQAIERRRDKSESWGNERARPYSPWTTSTDAMWRKSAVRALVPFLELSSEAHSQLSKDEMSFVKDADGEIVNNEQEPDWIEGSIVDDETGEIIEADNKTEDRIDPTPEVIDVEGIAVQDPEEEKSWKFLLKVIMRENEITGPDRFAKIKEATGNTFKAWNDIDEESAQKTALALDPTAHL